MHSSDVHAGSGCVIGFTANLGDKVIPNIVGVDIGCGMRVCELGKIDIDLVKLDEFINKSIPSGLNANSTILKEFDLTSLNCYKSLQELDWINRSLGTLGGGNHFIEIDVDEDGCKYLVIHTGSRNLGKQVADIYQKLAIKLRNECPIEEREELIKDLKLQGRHKEISIKLKELNDKYANNKIPDKLCYLDGKDRENYLKDMKLCQKWAIENRALIAKKITEYLGLNINNIVEYESVHNYIDDVNMVRKGAISAHKGEKVIIPMNMKDGCILGIGLGNEDWNESAPHGAGRIMARGEAKRNLDLEEFKASMKGIYSTSVNFSSIDESPKAYKPMQEIIDSITDTVKIIKIIKPIYNFKAADKEEEI